MWREAGLEFTANGKNYNGGACMVLNVPEGGLPFFESLFDPQTSLSAFRRWRRIILRRVVDHDHPILTG